MVVLAALAALAPVATDAATVRVAIIVGPTGTLTPMLRDQAERAAVVAENAGAQVIRVYSPNATWPVVEAAARGASVVVYMGHGYGFPSPYRSHLSPSVHNGFGLNPIAGVDDVAHQYFGESRVDDLALAPNAVVVLSHLCYASGSGEPGMPDPPLPDVLARVDNFAAGFIRAGAIAVIAEAYHGPAYYVAQLLSSDKTVDQIWRDFPGAHDREFQVASTRSPGFTLHLDPTRPSASYDRSLVSRAEIGAGAVRDGASVAPRPPALPAGEPASWSAVSFGDPILAAAPIADTESRLTLPLLGGAGQVPAGVQLGVRWDPIQLAVSSEPAPEEQPTDQPNLVEPPALDLVVPEALGTVVALLPARQRAQALTARVSYPAQPGLYRLVLSFHRPDGIAVALDGQAQPKALLVEVAGAVGVAYRAPEWLQAASAQPLQLAMRIANVGSEGWALPIEPESETLPEPAYVVATWLSTDGLVVPQPVRMPLDAETSSAGSDTIVMIGLVAPVYPGRYLLALDVISALHGPLSSLGSPVALVRVSVADHLSATGGIVSSPDGIDPVDRGVLAE